MIAEKLPTPDRREAGSDSESEEDPDTVVNLDVIKWLKDNKRGGEEWKTWLHDIGVDSPLDLRILAVRK